MLGGLRRDSSGETQGVFEAQSEDINNFLPVATRGGGTGQIHHAARIDNAATEENFNRTREHCKGRTWMSEIDADELRRATQPGFFTAIGLIVLAFLRTTLTALFDAVLWFIGGGLLFGALGWLFGASEPRDVALTFGWAAAIIGVLVNYAIAFSRFRDAMTQERMKQVERL